MRPTRRAATALLALLALAAELTAQVPAAIDFPSDASSAAMGSAGVAMWGRLGPATVNPAAVGTVPDFSLQSALSSNRGADESGFAMRSSLPVGFAVAAVEYQHKAVSDLIEDPAIDESGLGVSDNSLRLAVARALGKGMAVGAAVSLGWSDVFDTDGSSHSFDLGIIGRPLPSVTLGASARRLGGSLEWSTPGGTESSVDVPVGYRVGAAFRGLRVKSVSFGLAGDVETGTGLGGTEYALGLEADYRSLFIARLGMRNPPAIDTYWTAGVGLHFKGIEAALSYELIDIIGPRLQLQIGVTPSAL